MRRLALAAAVPWLVAAGPDGPFVHQQMLEQFADAPPRTQAEVGWPTADQLALKEERSAGGPTVMGYLPYWVAAENIPWESLDILAFFAVGSNADGSLGGGDGWGDAAADDLVAAAHAADVDVVLSTTRFGGSEVHQLLDNPAARTAAIDNLIQAMLDGGGDGIDIDYEGLLAADRDNMIAFVQELRVELDAAQPGSLLTMATPAVDWSGAWDYDVIMESADVLFIMGYAFHGSFSDPGPTAPLNSGAPWGSRSLRWSVQDYVTWGGVEHADQVVLGLPLYGNTWEASGPGIGASATGDSWSIFWDDGRAIAAEHGEQWEPVAAGAWSAYDDGGWHQSWYESVESIDLKIGMAFEEGIGGFGFWALNYDEGDSELWDTVFDWNDVWGDDDDDATEPTDDDDATEPTDDDDDATEPPGNRPPSAVVDVASLAEVGDVVSIDASASSDPEGDPLSFSWTQDGGPSVALLEAEGSTPSFLAYEAGLHSFTLALSDGVNAPVELPFAVRIMPTASDAPEPDEEAGCACSAGSRSGGWLLLPLLLLRRRR